MCIKISTELFDLQVGEDAETGYSHTSKRANRVKGLRQIKASRSCLRRAHRENIRIRSRLEKSQSKGQDVESEEKEIETGHGSGRHTNQSTRSVECEPQENARLVRESADKESSRNRHSPVAAIEGHLHPAALRIVYIKGVILNFVGGQRHERKLRQIVETYTDLAILGVMYKDSELLLEERYLGLMPSNEDPQAQQRIQALGQRITEQIDLELLLALASPLPDTQFKQTVASIPAIQYPVRIAYAKDRAFGFYYADDLNTFSELGATLIPFDIL